MLFAPSGRVVGMVLFCILTSATAAVGEKQAEPPHPWRPPFGLDRVGARRGATEPSPPLEAAALARSDTTVHPVDLGLIFVADGWLVLGPGHKPLVDVAALAHERDVSDAHLRAWFESAPKKVRRNRIDLARGVRQTFALELDAPRLSRSKDTLRVAITDAQGQELWSTSIPVVLVEKGAALPKFGAYRLKLRYDMPIVLNRSETGQLDMSKIDYLDYSKGWDPKLDDVVVSLPNGSRFVFWRGSGYIPFWAGPRNTGVCYEWAETGPPPDGFVDSVEPLMDKELRYSRVEILESTPARVRVRWTYQSTDFNYKVWGDQAVEEFCFYPDGYGTRTLKLKKRPDAQYELSEFIVLAAPGMYPLSFLPTDAVEMFYLDGMGKHVFHFPPHGYTPDQGWPLFEPARKGPVVYRVRPHVEDPASAVYFHASDDHFPMVQFGPFYDGQALVTPAYWGAHWPLTRGKSTGARIDPLIELSPSHNSLLSWAQSRKPDPDFRGRVATLDTLGRSAEMAVEHYTWLIAMTAEPDARVVDRARSFARPPSLQLQGATLDPEAYVASRRSLRIEVLARQVSVVIEPAGVTVDPVFELGGAPRDIRSITLGGLHLPPHRYAWDGQTLWVSAVIDQPQRLEIAFR